MYIHTYAFNGGNAIAQTYCTCRDHLHQTLQLYTAKKKKWKKSKCHIARHYNILLYTYIYIIYVFICIYMYLCLLHCHSI